MLNAFTFSQTKKAQVNTTEELVVMPSHINASGKTYNLALTDSTSAYCDVMAIGDLELKQPYRILAQVQRQTDTRNFTTTKVKNILSVEKVAMTEFIAMCKQAKPFEISYTQTARPSTIHD